MLGAFILNKKPHRNLMDLKFSDYIEVEEIFSRVVEPNFSRSPLELNVLCLTRELPGDALVNISSWKIFTENGNAFHYSEIWKKLFFQIENNISP